MTSVHGAVVPVPPEMDGTVMVGQDFRGERQIKSQLERNVIESYTHIQAHTHTTCASLYVTVVVENWFKPEKMTS